MKEVIIAHALAKYLHMHWINIINTEVVLRTWNLFSYTEVEAGDFSKSEIVIYYT